MYHFHVLVRGWTFSLASRMALHSNKIIFNSKRARRMPHSAVELGCLTTEVPCLLPSCSMSTRFCDTMLAPVSRKSSLEATLSLPSFLPASVLFLCGAGSPLLEPLAAAPFDTNVSASSPITDWRVNTVTLPATHSPPRRMISEAPGMGCAKPRTGHSCYLGSLRDSTCIEKE
jgi:hypothetical protein